VHLGDATAYLFDVDGTLVLSDDPNAGIGGAQVLPGAGAVLTRLREQGKRIACFTNGTGQVPSALAARLRKLGLDIADDEMLTPSVVAAEYIRCHHAGQTVLAFGNEGVLEPLRQAALPLASLEEAEGVGVVLVGADPAFTYEKLVAACRAVWAGAPLLVTSMAAFFVSRRGRMPSTSGAIVAGIRHVTGVEPKVVGKPSVLVMEVVAQLLEVDRERIAVVGDDLELEIRMAREAGAFSVLVLTGSSNSAAVNGTPIEHRPHVVIPSVGDLLTFV
jgi:HAD superfamily hydrolase (TIGR01450 family)